LLHHKKHFHIPGLCIGVDALE